MTDPMDMFVHEKTALAGAPNTAGVGDDYKIPQKLSRSAFDPGERALAAVASVSGSLSTIAVPVVGRMIIAPVMKRDSVSWKRVPPLQNAESIAHALSGPQGGITKGRILGLLDVKGRTRTIPSGVIEREKFGRKYVGKLFEMQPVVDSFIDKHNLAKKGVRINIQHGPLSMLGGGGFSKATKQVYLPMMGKAVALHELGHAADYTKGFGKIRRLIDPVLSRSVIMALPIALAAGDRIKEMIPGTIDDKAIAFMQDNAPEIMGATLAATTLIPEAKASFLAVKHLKELEAAGKQKPGTALKAAKKLIPFWGTYLLGAIPAIVGMSLARKYMRAARSEKAELESGIERQIKDLEKSAGLIGDWVSHGKDLGYVAKQIGIETVGLLKNKNTIGRIGEAAKEIGQSPEFIWGAISSAIPATMGALYMYGTPGGELVRDRLEPRSRDIMLGHTKRKVPGISSKDEQWRKENPLRFAGLVALGAAMAGGITSKFMHDMMKVL